MAYGVESGGLRQSSLLGQSGAGLHEAGKGEAMRGLPQSRDFYSSAEHWEDVSSHVTQTDLGFWTTPLAVWRKNPGDIGERHHWPPHTQVRAGKALRVLENPQGNFTVRFSGVLSL